MVGSSAADQSAVTEATDQRKKTGRQPAKTRAEKDAHNARCVKYRQKIKMRFEALKKVETEYLDLLPKFNQMRVENQRIKKELNESNSKIRYMEIENQELRRALEKQGRNFSNFDELVAWFASKTYDQIGQDAGTSETVLQDVNELVHLGTTGTDNFLPSIVANNGLPCVLGAPNNGVNNDHFPHHDHAIGNKAGFLSGAGSFFAANDDLPMFYSPNNHDGHNSDLFTSGSLFWENPSSKAVSYL